MRKKIEILLVCLMLVTSLLVVFPIENTKAEVPLVVLEPTDDTYLSKGDWPDTPQGDIDDIFIRNAYGAGGSNIFECDGLIKFDISSIPLGTMVLSAELKLYYWDWYDNNPAGSSR